MAQLQWSGLSYQSLQYFTEGGITNKPQQDKTLMEFPSAVHYL
jgi:hypothetical protein